MAEVRKIKIVLILEQGELMTLRELIGDIISRWHPKTENLEEKNIEKRARFLELANSLYREL